MQFERAAKARSPWPRSMAFAALGAAEVLSVHPGIGQHANSSPTTPTPSKPNGDSAWPWPEPRLTYANAVLAEAMIAAGVALDDSTLWQRGLELFGWLLEDETAEGHLSPTPVAGSGPDDLRPAFDQQPIEVSTLADACARAAAIDASSIWPEGVRAAAAWFMGVNDADSACGTRRPAADSTACRPTASTATRARSRRWQ